MSYEKPVPFEYTHNAAATASAVDIDLCLLQFSWRPSPAQKHGDEITS